MSKLRFEWSRSPWVVKHRFMWRGWHINSDGSVSRVFGLKRLSVYLSNVSNLTPGDSK